MAEDIDEQKSGAEEAAVGAEPISMTLALGSASRDEADAFLKKQGALIDDQRHHLNEQFGPQLRQLHLGVWEKRLGVLLRIATAFTGLAIAAGLAFLVWDASRSNGLLIEPFSVPPDLAQRGLTGEVVAGKLLDQLAAMQSQTSSQRAPATYANSWSQQDIKLDIPETGLSLAELDGFLREKLGHDTHITGEIVRTSSGLSLTARAGGDGAPSVSGPETDIDALVQRLSESIYGLTQPYRYAIYLREHGRAAEANPVLESLAKTGPQEERSWGYLAWGIAAQDTDGPDVVLARLEKAAAAGPENSLVWNDIAEMDDVKSLPEQVIRSYRTEMSVLSGSGPKLVRADLIPIERTSVQANIDLQSGAFQDASQEQEKVVQFGIPGRFGVSAELAFAQIGAHDLAAARATLADPVKDSGLNPGLAALYEVWADTDIASAARNWTGILSQAAKTEPLVQKYPGVQKDIPTTTAPLVAYAQAKLGDVDAAETTIATTPADCYACLRAQALIAELQGQHARADFWFAKAGHLAPSIPFADNDWGQALLARGDAAGAIAKFKLANQKGPHFADPLEGWGESLMVQNRSDLALAKFAQAEPFAPNWGRLHLKWGEALGYAGKKDEARAQFVRAAALDLTPSEKAELAKVSHG